MSNLQEAFREAARREFAAVPDETELDYVFSRKFERRMRRIIRAQVHGYWHMVNTLGKRIAIAAAILVMLLTSVMAIKPIRERVIKFFVDVYEDYFEISFGEEVRGDLSTSQIPMARYTFSELPQGYYEEEHTEIDPSLWTTWRNDEGYGIVLQQEVGTQNITIDYGNKQLTIIEHNELIIAFQKQNGTSSYVWNQNGYTFYLTIYEDIPITQVLDLIDSLIIA